MCDDEVFVTIPSDARHLRTLRLVAADAGERAGLDASEVDDLRTATGELGQALMQVTTRPITMAIRVADATVTIRVTAQGGIGTASPALTPIASLMVDAVTDLFRLEGEGTSQVAYVVTKRAGAFAS